MSYQKLLQCTVAVALLASFSAGCGMPTLMPTPMPTLTPKPTVNPPPVTTPLCDIKIDPEQKVLIYNITLFQRPPFYSGPIPLEYKAAQKPLGMGLGNPTVAHIFDKWTTTFAYVDSSFEVSGIATCARTLSDSGHLLAEARFEEIIKGEGIIILEVHYNVDKSVRFWCRSRISFGTGSKTNEIEAYGVKERDYYFTWPVSS